MFIIFLSLCFIISNAWITFNLRVRAQRYLFFLAPNANWNAGSVSYCMQTHLAGTTRSFILISFMHLSLSRSKYVHLRHSAHTSANANWKDNNSDVITPYQFDDLLNAKCYTDVDCLSDLVHWNGVNILSSGQRCDKSVFDVKTRRYYK